jgi:hypothetical protein
MTKSEMLRPIASTKRGALFASRPSAYLCIVLVAILSGFMFQLRSRTIFSCQADGYNADRYLAYCNGAGYADYEHGAFWFDLEPAAREFAQASEVLFLGNSRMEVAFSTDATANWFAAESTRYYLLGFSYNANMLLAQELLRKIQPRAKAYVINVDDFFYKTESPPMKTVLHDPKARELYEEKHRWQQVHEPICRTLPILCGNNYVIFRSRQTGAYTKKTDKEQIAAVSYDQAVDPNIVHNNTAAAVDFLSRLSVQRQCVILTMVPTVETKIGNVTAIADALGVNLTTPERSLVLRTFDGSHLDKASAEVWSQAFFRAASTKIRGCLGHSSSVGSLR